jgi:hypothetical protein
MMLGKVACITFYSMLINRSGIASFGSTKEHLLVGKTCKESDAACATMFKSENIMKMVCRQSCAHQTGTRGFALAR